jgi:hypothetical protein
LRFIPKVVILVYRWARPVYARRSKRKEMALDPKMIALGVIVGGLSLAGILFNVVMGYIENQKKNLEQKQEAARAQLIPYSNLSTIRSASS